MLEEVKELLNKLDSVSPWAIKLIKIHSTVREGFSCVAREIQFDSNEALKNHILDIKENYLGHKPVIEKYNAVREYDGTTETDVIYTLETSNKLVKDSFETVMNALAGADHEADPLKEKYNAYVLSGNVDDKPIYIFSMQSPFVNMKRKYLFNRTVFKEIDKPVLSLRLNIDVLIYGDEIYLFSMAGENLFNMERAYKSACSYCISGIIDSGILVENEVFSKIAKSGNNPRRLICFNEAYLEKLKNRKTREKIAKKFGIPTIEGLFDTEQDGAADKLIRILCNRGMVDPFGAEPMEVSGSRNWR